MNKNISINLEPLVTVLLPTYNRPQSLGTAINSVLAQTYQQFELIIIRDGGQSVDSVIQCYNDSRIRFIDRDQNRGKATSLNEALAVAKGEYVCYLDDDDMWYPHHIQTLVEALLSNPQYGLTYSDLYKVHYRPIAGDRRQILAKNLEISRDFDRMLMLQFNHVLHVSLMHRRDLLDKAGPYNETLNVLIDWDLTRRLCFYTDYLHVPVVTGEYFAAVDNSDRISVQRRKDANAYLRNLLTIRSTRPPKPWPCMSDLSVIVLHDRCDEKLSKTLADLWSHSYYPSRYFVPLSEVSLSDLQTVVPNVVKVPVTAHATVEQKIDAVLSICEGDYVAVVPVGLSVENDEVSFLERSLNPLIQKQKLNVAYELVEAGMDCWGAVFRRSELSMIRQQYPDLSVRQGASACGIEVMKPEYSDYPFQFDNLLTAAGQLQRDGDWARAVSVYEYMQEHYVNTLWMQTLKANAYYQCGQLTKARQLSHQLNQIHPTVSRLLIEARANNKAEDWAKAMELYRSAAAILDGAVNCHQPGSFEVLMNQN